jgi:coenzyme F420-0:L-glutamate ligase/coenzyme F420-1:gamma-L-glutamate ligase
VELILQESKEILRITPEVIVVEHRLGFICANAGIDQSNIEPLEPSQPNGKSHQPVLLLPIDVNASAEKIKNALETLSGKRLGVLIIDTQGRAWRMGVVGMSIGLAGLSPLEDMRGEVDLFGKPLRITMIAAADELAAAASLMMGQAAEGKPVVHVRGYPYPLREGIFSQLLRNKQSDLFR